MPSTRKPGAFAGCGLMSGSLAYLVPLALALGVVALGAFLWSLGSGQYDDLDGAAERIFIDDEDDRIAGADERSTNAPGETARDRPG